VDAWQLAWLFKHHPLAAFRLTQLARSRFRLELESERKPPRLEAELREALARLGWAEPQLEVVAGVRIGTEGGKPEPFRCAIGPGEAGLSG
jgi:hypothetical protein